jgi:hypothetical protein
LSFGHRLVDHLNVGAISGLLIAIAGYFWANRLIPAAMPGREQWEINSFLILWLIAFLHPILRPLKRAWMEQLVLGGMLFAAIPLLSVLTGNAHLGMTIPNGNWVVAGFDLTCLATGLALLETARRLSIRREAKGRRAIKAREANTAVLAAAK